MNEAISSLLDACKKVQEQDIEITKMSELLAYDDNVMLRYAKEVDVVLYNQLKHDMQDCKQSVEHLIKLN